MAFELQSGKMIAILQATGIADFCLSFYQGPAMSATDAFEKRTAGILLHPTSLPSSESYWGDDHQNAFGTLGREAFNFIDFIAAAGLTVWQVLPLVPTEDNLSPYQSTSVHAGNPD